MLWEKDGLDPGAVPDVFYALPELHYPRRFNAAEVLLQGSHGEHRGDRPVFIHKDRSLSRTEVTDQVNRHAAALRSIGVKADDRVLIRVADSPELIFITLAVVQLGAIAIPTYTQYRAADLRLRITDAGVTTAVVGPELLSDLEQAAAESAGVQIVVTSSAPSPRFRSMEDLLATASPLRDYTQVEADELALILYTSGSTGQPKGTCHSHADLLAVCDSYARYAVKLSRDDVIAGPPAYPFALGVGFFMLFPLRFGCTAIVDSDKSPEQWLALSQRHGATLFVAVATYYHMLLAVSGSKDWDPGSVSRYLCGGEPLTDELARAWMTRTGQPLSQFLGTTELLHCFLAFRHGEDEVQSNAIGRPVPGYEIVVRDKESFAALPAGEHGILSVRGPTGTKYWRQPGKQRDAVVNGWNIVPDVVWADPDGYLHFVARDDEVIKSAGMRISPTQAEDAVLAHEAVEECVCVGAPDPQGARPAVVKAYIVLAEGFEPSDALVVDIQNFVKRTAAPYLYPRVVQFLTDLPKTTSGKVKRLELREDAWLHNQVEGGV